MNRFILNSVLFASLSFGNASAMQIKDSASDGIINATISGIDLNRIKVISDRISSVRHNDGELEVLQDVSKGEIYVRTNATDPISLFITTEKDYTYQILLVPKKVPSEQIFIKNEEAILDSISEEVIGSDSYKESISDLISAMRSEEELEGYTRIRKQGQSGRKKLLISYEGEFYMGEVYRYKHEGFRKKRVSELFKDYLAISSDKNEVYGGDEVTVYVVRGV